MVRSLRNFKGRKTGMIFKIDLEKAYDRIHGDFLKDTLSEAELPPMLITVIMNCVFSVTFQVLWNGMVTDEFRPTRGLR